MAHINIKFQDSAEAAVAQVVALNKYAKEWDFGGEAFGRSVNERRAIDAAIKAKDHSAFKAFQRKGYWRVELADK
jgi:hypothetical protein